MTKRNKIIYWVATGFLCFGMSANGTAQLIHHKGFADMFAHLGYPAYFMTILGAWKLLGVIALLIPKFPLLKEWAYAGFFFAMSGALFSHIAVADPLLESGGAVVLLGVIVTSWYFRPADRKITPVNQ
ncbi:MAG: DoxX family protein [Bacteroidota bacterium]